MFIFPFNSTKLPQHLCVTERKATVMLSYFPKIKQCFFVYIKWNKGIDECQAERNPKCDVDEATI